MESPFVDLFKWSKSCLEQLGLTLKLLWVGEWTRWPSEIPSTLNYSMILWLYALPHSRQDLNLQTTLLQTYKACVWGFSKTTHLTHWTLCTKSSLLPWHIYINPLSESISQMTCCCNSTWSDLKIYTHKCGRRHLPAAIQSATKSGSFLRKNL